MRVYTTMKPEPPIQCFILQPDRGCLEESCAEAEQYVVEQDKNKCDFLIEKLPDHRIHTERCPVPDAITATEPDEWTRDTAGCEHNPV
ncbi:hypothetical protein AVEN_173483-1 [Araneus ventricosus]|uniref:Uncharacterized protein n=1 Tax=Araneus ventricosus TaxID=182803 RepID=A0A4Y2KJG8_ARAVE|nr:hypothetical protein AVEN_173483-1 [Araneus ventricosus]